MLVKPRFVLTCAVLGDGKMTDNVSRERLQIEQLSHSTDLKSSGRNRAGLSLWNLLLTSSVLFQILCSLY